MPIREEIRPKSRPHNEIAGLDRRLWEEKFEALRLGQSSQALWVQSFADSGAVICTHVDIIRHCVLR